tara:strand:- start:674 stop:934 length:261 start_codon:yes stop_codon:yes gene_type:complete
MARTNKNKNNLDWLNQLREEFSGGPVTVPAGWLTVKQLAKESGMSEVHTRKVVAKGVENGTVEVKKFKIQTITRLMPVPHYKEKKR